MRRMFLGVALVLLGCGDDDDAPRDIDGGFVDASVPSDGGVDASEDASLDASATLCAKYGGPAGVERAIKSYVLRELATDCRVGLHFVALPANRLARFGDCLSFQAQEMFGCPGVTYANSKSPNGLPCRDMKAAHAGLALTTGDFDAVLTDVASGLLKAGIAQADIDMIAPALLGLEPEIVESPALAPSKSCDQDASGPVDGGTDAGG